jgi:GAF domain-containing protein
VSGTVKAPVARELADFFEGVAEMRAHLDRRLQDPERRRRRLAAIARELLRPREGRELCRWLVTELAAAVGASSAAVWVREHGDALTLWHALGAPPPDPTSHPGESTAPTAPDGLMLPLAGADGPVGALWLQARTPLDPDTAALVAALAETAGVALEQALLLAAMG